MMGLEPRQTTSNVGHLHKPSIQALVHGLNRHYYSIAIDYRKSELEQAMLLNLHKKRWADGLTLSKFDELAKRNDATITVRVNKNKNSRWNTIIYKFIFVSLSLCAYVCFSKCCRLRPLMRAGYATKRR